MKCSQILLICITLVSQGLTFNQAIAHSDKHKIQISNQAPEAETTLQNSASHKKGAIKSRFTALFKFKRPSSSDQSESNSHSTQGSAIKNPELSSHTYILPYLLNVIMTQIKASQSDTELKKHIEEAHSLLNLINDNTRERSLTITPDEFNQIQTLSYQVEHLCPPIECIVIGIGRSPTPITAYLRTQHASYVWNLPLSSFRYSQKDLSKPALSSDLIEDLFEHFSHYIPRYVTHKRILLLDFSVTGATLVSAKEYIEYYLSDILRSQSPVSTAAITTLNDYLDIDRGIDHIIHISKSKLNPLRNPLTLKLINEEYDRFAEFGRFKIEKSDRPVASNPKYDQFLLDIIKLSRDESTKVPDWNLYNP